MWRRLSKGSPQSLCPDGSGPQVVSRPRLILVAIFLAILAIGVWRTFGGPRVVSDAFFSVFWFAATFAFALGTQKNVQQGVISGIHSTRQRKRSLPCAVAREKVSDCAASAANEPKCTERHEKDSQHRIVAVEAVEAEAEISRPDADADAEDEQREDWRRSARSPSMPIRCICDSLAIMPFEKRGIAQPLERKARDRV
jgi:hypothetical protein